MNITKIPCHASNRRSGRLCAVRFIVMHYTANKGDTAKGNGQYFSRTANIKASAHFFVDEGGVVQSVPPGDTAWHCGGGLQGRKGHVFHGVCTNSNSIGVEMCLWDKQGRIRSGTVDMAVSFVRELMEEYGIDADHVIRHYDVTGKLCPRPWVEDETQWQAFKARLEEEDMTKEEVKKIVNETLKEQDPVWNTVTEVPDWGRSTVDKLVKRGVLKGTGTGLGLTADLLRVLVINDRAGVYGK